MGNICPFISTSKNKSECMGEDCMFYSMRKCKILEACDDSEYCVSAIQGIESEIQSLKGELEEQAESRF